MAALSFKFASMTGNSEAASSLWATSIQTTGTTSGFLSISTLSLLALLVAWALIYYCIRNGASSVVKVVKYTVFIPIICLVVMAIKGITMPGGIDGLIKLFKPDLSILKTPNIWIDACGQVFYSLSIMMAIMFAYVNSLLSYCFFCMLTFVFVYLSFYFLSVQTADDLYVYYNIGLLPSMVFHYTVQTDIH